MKKKKRFFVSITNAIDRIRYKKIGEESSVVTAIGEKMIYSILKQYIKAEKEKGWSEDTGVFGRINRFTGKLTVMYRFRSYEPRIVPNYFTYYIMAKITEDENNRHEIRYSFVYDRLIVWMFRILGVLYFFPLIFVLTNYDNSGGFYIVELIGTIIMAICGLLMLFTKEKVEDASKVIEIFEKDIHALFPI